MDHRGRDARGQLIMWPFRRRPKGVQRAQDLTPAPNGAQLATGDPLEWLKGTRIKKFHETQLAKIYGLDDFIKAKTPDARERRATLSPRSTASPGRSPARLRSRHPRSGGWSTCVAR